MRRTIVKLRRYTAKKWAEMDPVLSATELGLETDTGQRKIGDGFTRWTKLGYLGSGGGTIHSGVGHPNDSSYELMAVDDFSTDRVNDKSWWDFNAEAGAGGYNLSDGKLRVTTYNELAFMRVGQLENLRATGKFRPNAEPYFAINLRALNSVSPSSPAIQFRIDAGTLYLNAEAPGQNVAWDRSASSPVWSPTSDYWLRCSVNGELLVEYEIFDENPFEGNPAPIAELGGTIDESVAQAYFSGRTGYVGLYADMYDEDQDPSVQWVDEFRVEVPGPAIGNPGDFYINEVGNVLYGPRGEDAYPAKGWTLTPEI